MTNTRLRGFILLLLDVRGEDAIRQLGGKAFVLGLRRGQVSEKLADAGVPGLFRRLYVKAMRLELHGFGLLADGFERADCASARSGAAAKTPSHPRGGWAANGCRSASDRGREASSGGRFPPPPSPGTPPRRLDNAPPDLPRSRINAQILFFRANRQGQDFALGQIGKFLRRMHQSSKCHRRTP